MSDVLVGWAATISLNATDTGIIAARRGEAALRFPDHAPAAAQALTQPWVDMFAQFQRGAAARGEPPPKLPVASDGRTLFVTLDRKCVEPLIAAMLGALAFSRGS